MVFCVMKVECFNNNTFLINLLRILHPSPNMVECVTEDALEVLLNNNLVPRRDRKAWQNGFGRFMSESSMSSIYWVANRQITKGESGYLENVGSVALVLDKLAFEKHIIMKQKYLCKSNIVYITNCFFIFKLTLTATTM